MLQSRPRELTAILTCRPIDIDEMADVRYLHATCFRIEAGQTHTSDQVRGFLDEIATVRYADEFLSHDPWGAWLASTLIATAGWCPADNAGMAARLTDVFVHPHFTRDGLGRQMALAAEERAQRAGFSEFQVRATLAGSGFFTRLGYARTSHGVRPLMNGADLPVVFMRKQRDLRALAH